jgi:D-amino-acid dehydrogenase
MSDHTHNELAAAAQRADVVVVGAGVIGAATAYELAKRDLNVVVIDRNDVGHGCSFGNAGWITPAFAMPLPMPGLLLKSLKWMCDPNSPLYIKPRANLELVRWLWRFMRCMNEPAARRAAAALAELARHSLDTYKQLDARQPGAFGFTQQGLLAVARTAEGLDAVTHEVELIEPLGVRAELLDAQSVRNREPAVICRELAGGVFFPDEAHAEPLATVQSLARFATDHGAQFFTGVELAGFDVTGRRVDALITTRGRLPFTGQLVLATGSWSNALGKCLGLRVPILAGKGYHAIIDPMQPMPASPMYLVERKVGVTPRDGSIRLAGTLELVDAQDDSITMRRVHALVRGAREYLPLPDPTPLRQIWRGLRPCTPDGVPIIGRPPTLDNLTLACGHQMLGLLCAPATALLAAQLVTGDNPSFDPAPFRADRF